MGDEKKEVLKVETGAGETKIKMTFPSNAHSDKATNGKTVAANSKDEPKKVEKVIKGVVVQKKRSLGKRFMETFIGDDINNVGSYILHDVLIPAAKSTISDMVQGGIEILLFGERKGSRTRRDNGRSYVSYNNYSSRDRREVSPQNRARHSFDELVFGTRGEAEEVLSHLVDLVDEYGQANVSDLYDLAGVTANFTDNKYGWTNLASASVSRVREGYVINLPKAILLD